MICVWVCWVCRRDILIELETGERERKRERNTDLVIFSSTETLAARLQIFRKYRHTLHGHNSPHQLNGSSDSTVARRCLREVERQEKIVLVGAHSSENRPIEANDRRASEGAHQMLWTTNCDEQQIAKQVDDSQGWRHRHLHR